MVRFRPGVKFRFDETRQAWIVLAPERLLLPDEIAVEVLKRIDGQRTVGQVIDDLAATFKAPRETIATDVRAMLGDLAAKGIVTS
ncbi:MAG: pyrroloquinoline quinone biosynthesis protein PqqD [Alphaproteobacteria bacterium 65-37]|nr:MAG: pyrroloquinoline quinone biosynthesis protein PqqD [Alphaproteobacteria bacterium 65-37]